MPPNPYMNQGVEDLITFIDNQLKGLYDAKAVHYNDHDMLSFYDNQIRVYNRVLSSITRIFGERIPDK